MRRPLARGATFLGGVAVACSAFDAGDERPGSPAVEAGVEASAADAETRPRIDPCASADPKAEYAGLYLASGLVDGVDTATVRREPLHCDGSVGELVDLDASHDVPRSFAAGGAWVAGDRVMLFGGQHSAGGPVYSKQPQIAQRQPDGTLGPFVLGPEVEDLDRWRFAVASDGNAAYVVGGEVSGNLVQAPLSPSWKLRSTDDAGNYAAEIDRIDRLTLTGSGALQGRRATTTLYASRARFGAGMADGILYAYGAYGTVDDHDNAVHAAVVRADGELEPWQSLPLDDGQFDVTMVATDHAVWLLGGESRPRAFAIAERVEGKPTVTRLKDLDVDVPDGVAVASRGFVYLLLTGGSTLLTGKLDRAGLSLTAGPPLPVKLVKPAMFVF